MLHSISLPPGEYGGDAIERLFTNRLDWNAHPYFETIRGLTVSSHFLIRRDGALLQFVSCDDRAWHAGASRWRGRDDCNDFSIGIELEGLEGEAFETAQYRGARRRCSRSLAPRYPIAARGRPRARRAGPQERSGRGLRLGLACAACAPSATLAFRGLIDARRAERLSAPPKVEIGDNRFVTNLRVRRYR